MVLLYVNPRFLFNFSDLTDVYSSSTTYMLWTANVTELSVHVLHIFVHFMKNKRILDILYLAQHGNQHRDALA